MKECENNEDVSIEEFIKVRLTRITGSEPDNRRPDQRFFEELEKLLIEFKTYGISEGIVYDTIDRDELLASLNKQINAKAKPSQTQEASIKQKLADLKNLLDQGFISKEEFNLAINIVKDNDLKKPKVAKIKKKI